MRNAVLYFNSIFFRPALCLILIFLLITGAASSAMAQETRLGAGSSKTNSKQTKKAPPSAKKEAGRRSSPDDQIEGVRYVGDPPIVETVAEIMERQKAQPSEKFDPNFIPAKIGHERYRPKKISPDRNSSAFADLVGEVIDPTWLLPQIVGTSIAGPGRTSDGISSIPPDSVGDVGPTQVLMHANGRIKVYDKFTGAVGGLDVADTTFWNSVRNGFGISDPRVEYDRLSGRWFLCMINVANTNNRIMIAVSSGPTITDTSSFSFFQITPAANFIDYPTLGVDNNALYIGGNIFTSSIGTFARTDAWVINKANLIAGSLTATYFASLASGSGAGPLTPQGISNDDPAATEGYFIGVDNAAFSLLQIRRVSTPGGTPTISGNISIATATTTYPMGATGGGGVPFQGATNGRSLDDLDDRLFQAQITRDNISGVSRLWTAHNIEVTTAGAASTTGNRDGSRWYEIGTLTTTPTIIQSGTLFDSAATNPNSYFIPSVAVSGQGHMAIGASSAGAARFPSLYAAGRLRTDSANATQSPTQIQSSTTAYNLEGANVTQRWGDYSKTTVDPCDNQTFWHVGEYSDTTNSWRMRAVQLRAAAPPATVSPSPSSISAGLAGTNVVATGVSITGTEFYDNPASFTCSPSCNTTGTGTCHIAASVTSSPLAPHVAVTINSVTFNTPTQVTLNINTINATPGTHTIRVTNPDGQFTSFPITVLSPTAASVPVSGRVLTLGGLGVRGAAVTMTDDLGNSRMVLTGAFGYYTFENVEAGRTYTVSVSAKRYTFSLRLVSVDDAIDGLDFIQQ